MIWFFNNIIIPFCAGWGAVDITLKLFTWLREPRYRDNYNGWSGRH